MNERSAEQICLDILDKMYDSALNADSCGPNGMPADFLRGQAEGIDVARRVIMGVFQID